MLVARLVVTCLVGKGLPLWQQQQRMKAHVCHGRLWAVRARHPLISSIPLLTDKTTHIPSQLGEEWLPKSSEMGPLLWSGQGTEEEK